jgi:hypothetical protein
MASNLRVSNVITLIPGQSASVTTPNWLPQAWGVLRGASGAGSITLQGVGTSSLNLQGPQLTYATMSIADALIVGEPFPCYVRQVTCTAGTVYLLA